jgi:hypothetical protein
MIPSQNKLWVKMKSTSQNLKKIDTFAEQIKVKWQRI